MGSLRSLFSKIFGSSEDRKIKVYRERVDRINAFEAELLGLSDDDLRAYTPALRGRIARGATLDDILVPAFAVVREAAKRVFRQRHFDVQLIGGMVLHEGRIAEMKTGEGKTLVATLPVYLNSLSGQGVHVVTVNDYLASRDAAWMGRIYTFLGLTVGVVTHGMTDQQRKDAYACDITYCTNNELGFDYLRDNMKYDLSQMVQRGHHFAIVDEVDSILIDEARTPLIISGPLEDQSELYVGIDSLILLLTTPEHIEVNEQHRTVVLTELGTDFAERALRDRGLLRGEGLYDPENISLVHHVDQALKAHKLFQRDRDYIVKDGAVVIIDEFTGRMMPGRRYSEGLHQALEAKERVHIQPENQTLASITFQNYFRLYDKLSGMTGTAATEADEFLDIYGLDLVAVPTNLPVSRIDDDDEVYRTALEKYEAIISLIEGCHARGQPVLVGTTSIAKSEEISALLELRGFKQQDSGESYTRIADKGQRVFRVLNARYHEQEAFIISQAGVPGAITVATNMAGRGTDIQLGGNADMRIQQELGAMPSGAERAAAEEAIRREVAVLRREALDAGGLYVIGTERHESRRIDNQLRGRSGRQGDPGHSHFFISLEDDLMRIFGSQRMDSMLRRLGLRRGEAITHPWVNKAIENAQRKVEARNFDMRKNLLKYDDVMNDQRQVIFEQRIKLIKEESAHQAVGDMRHEVIEKLIDLYIPDKAYVEQWDLRGLTQHVERILALQVPFADWAQEETGITKKEVSRRLIHLADEAYAAKMGRVFPDLASRIEKMILLQMIDHLWREHLLILDHLRHIVGLRGYGQRDPLNEYKAEAFSLFESMLSRLREMVTGQLMHGQFVADTDFSSVPLPPMQVQTSHLDPDEDNRQPIPRTERKVSRNALCPCGSGKKHKHCHGSLKGF